LLIAAVTAGLLLLPAVLLYGRTHQNELTEAANRAAQKRITPYPAPSFSAQTMSGTTVQLAQYRGEPVVVSFFAAWCEPCVKDAPAVAKLAADYRGRVQVLSVARASGRDGAERFIHDNGITWPVLWDGSDALTGDFRILGQPATFVIDQQGRVVDAQMGAVSEQRFHQTLDRLLAG
jgi:peroxiredoxin